MNDNNNFYKNLLPFTNSIELTDLKHFVAAPATWSLIMTDVRGSTKAIHEGRYKDVNVIGAATIVATQNACPNIEFPFVFGGDGATFIVPPEFIEKVKKALSHTRAVAKTQFNLDLRIAIFPIEKIYAEKKEILIAKLELSPKNSIAMIQGGGVSLGEQWMKASAEFNLGEDHAAEGDLSGLECRWNPVKSSKDGILSMIIQTQNFSAESNLIYRELLEKILAMVPSCEPVTVGKINLSWPPQNLLSELNMKNLKTFKKYFYYFGLLMLTWIFSKIVPSQIAKPTSKVNIFLKQLSKNTDYIKFDDTLRMIIDVSKSEEGQIRKLLESYMQAGKIFYGLHIDDEALMTCFVQSLDKHIHFLDGGSGGYAIAAKEFKEQKQKVMNSIISIA